MIHLPVWLYCIIQSESNCWYVWTYAIQIVLQKLMLCSDTMLTGKLQITGSLSVNKISLSWIRERESGGLENTSILNPTQIRQKGNVLIW